jgi:hypothetical protein
MSCLPVIAGAYEDLQCHRVARGERGRQDYALTGEGIALLSTGAHKLLGGGVAKYEVPDVSSLSRRIAEASCGAGLSPTCVKPVLQAIGSIVHDVPVCHSILQRI